MPYREMPLAKSKTKVIETHTQRMCCIPQQEKNIYSYVYLFIYKGERRTKRTNGNGEPSSLVSMTMATGDDNSSSQNDVCIDRAALVPFVLRR